MPQPLLYEINTRCWLREVSEARGQPVTLGTVPEAEFLRWQQLGFTHIWLMGVWAGGPRARAQALASLDLAKAFSEALPDWTEADVGASPYAIADYHVPASLGGEKGLTDFRRKLNTHGLKLVLDFVPNHLGVDHPWVQARPELFVNSTVAEPDTFAEQTVNGLRHLAYGKDPYCPAWTDTVQLDYRRAETRAAMTGQLQEVAGLCDGVRCDMAMLVLNEAFANTWNKYPIGQPRIETEFWAEATSAVRRRYKGFLFLAEVYWGLEGRLQSLGFDYTYDKTLYDRLIMWEPGTVQKHLLGLPASNVSGSAHFLENHDEPRVAGKLEPATHRAAALTILGLPGMRFLHEGQLSGWRRRLPVQLLRRAREPENAELRQMYDQLLGALPMSAIGQGTSALLTPRQAWPDNPTAQHFILVQWTGPNSRFDLVAINLAPHRSQCYAPVQLPSPAPQTWTLNDLLGDERFIRSHDELKQRGLYLDLPPHGVQILHFEPAKETRPA